MAWQRISGLWVPGWPEASTPHGPAFGGATMNGDEHELQFIGHVVLEAGSGSKTFDTSCFLEWATGAITFADDGSNDPRLRVGVKQASSIDLTTAPARATVGAAAFDVYGDYVGGTDTISANAWQRKAMSSGSLSISHGDLLAISIHLDKPGAAAQSVTPRWQAQAATVDPLQFPLAMLYNGSTWSAQSHGGPVAVLEFADGSRGWLFGSSAFSSGTTTPGNMGTGARANTLIFPYGVKIDACLLVGQITADLDVCLWSDPFGSPAVLQSKTWDKDLYGGTINRFGEFFLGTPWELTANTLYAFGVDGSASASNNLPWFWTVDNVAHHQVGNWDDAIYAATSSGGTGVFTSLNSGRSRYAVHARICEIDIPTGGGTVIAGTPMRRGMV